jgi:hypothetical protein
MGFAAHFVRPDALRFAKSRNIKQNGHHPTIGVRKNGAEVNNHHWGWHCAPNVIAGRRRSNPRTETHAINESDFALAVI